MEAVGKLDHPHIIRATDAGEADGRHFLVLEYVEGMDLGRVVNLCQPLSIADACELCRQAALGLQYIYEHGLVHRDIKPSNLWLTTAGEVKILDLGLACLQASLDDEEMTGSPARIVGTADYMAPEQTHNPNQVDIRADLYSLGCTLYKLLTGKAPFTGPTYVSAVKKLLAHAQASVPPIRDHRSDTEDGLAALVDRLLAKSPRDRFAVPADVVAALEPFTAGADLRRLSATARSSSLLHPPLRSTCASAGSGNSHAHGRHARSRRHRQCNHRTAS